MFWFLPITLAVSGMWVSWVAGDRGWSWVQRVFILVFGIFCWFTGASFAAITQDWIFSLEFRFGYGVLFWVLIGVSILMTAFFAFVSSLCPRRNELQIKISESWDWPDQPKTPPSQSAVQPKVVPTKAIPKRSAPQSKRPLASRRIR
ncbi:MAG TPA: hypothetical protein VFQ60_00740 [Patescibacteria group bacterium]|nr:hypothetical protein [Patescibacteria group bacterium]